MADASQDPKGQAKFGTKEFEQLKAVYKKLGLELNQTMEQFVNKLGGPEGALKHFRAMRKEAIDLTRDLGGAVRELTNISGELQNGDKWLKEAVKSTNKITSLASELRDEQVGINQLEEKRLKTMIESLQKERIRLNNALQMGNLGIAQEQNIRRALEVLEDTLETSEKRLAEEKKINETMGISGSIVEGITKSLEKLGIRSEYFENLKKDMRAAAESGSKWNVLMTGLQGVLKGIGTALRDPLVLIGLAYKAFKGLYDLTVQYESKLFEISKTLGVSLKQSEQLFERFRGIAISNNQLALTSKQIAEHYGQMNASMGFMGPISEEFLTTSLGIQRRTGATAEDMQNMALFSKSTGKTLEQTYATVIGTAKATAVQNNFMMSEKQIMEGISKSSATVFNNFKGNVAQLGAAVVQATKLGTTLDQMNQAGMQMLDFESSISKQFEAQLLTGKNLDLSRARQYALTGKTQDLMKEITTQLGSQEAWSKMNVLQQQSLAEALGMSKESVDEMFKKQRLVNELGDLANASTKTQYETLVKQGKSHDDIAKLLGDEAANSIKQASVQEQMAVVMENLKDSFAEVSRALLPIVRWFSGILSNVENLKTAMYGVAAGALVLVGYSVHISREKTKQLLTTQQNIAAQTRLAQLQLQITAAANEEALAKNAALRSSIQEAVADRAALPTDVSRTQASIVRAGAESAAGSGYLGPLALGVGALVIAGLSAYLMSAGLGGGGGGGGAAVPLPPSTPSAGMNPANAATMGGGGASGRPMIQSVANERPINVTFQAQVVDTGANMSSRADKGVYFDRTKYN
jgi:hypothetical protein